MLKRLTYNPLMKGQENIKLNLMVDKDINIRQRLTNRTSKVGHHNLAKARYDLVK